MYHSQRGFDATTDYIQHHINLMVQEATSTPKNASEFKSQLKWKFFSVYMVIHTMDTKTTFRIQLYFVKEL